MASKCKILQMLSGPQYTCELSLRIVSGVQLSRFQQQQKNGYWELWLLINGYYGYQKSVYYVYIQHVFGSGFSFLLIGGFAYVRLIHAR